MEPTDFLLTSIAGINTNFSWSIREKALSFPELYKFLALSLTGLDDPNSMELREKLFASDDTEIKKCVLRSFVGINNDLAWRRRREMLAKGNIINVLDSLIGISNKESWDIRKEALFISDEFHDQYSLPDDGNVIPFPLLNESLAISMAAIEDEKATLFRDTLIGLDEMYPNPLLLLSLQGIDSLDSWRVRLRFYNRHYNYNAFLALSLAGVNSQKA